MVDSPATIRISCQRTCLAAVRHFVDEYLTHQAVAPRLAAQLQVAVDEVCANIIIHGNHEDPGCSVMLQVRRQANAVIFEFFDKGEPFQAPPPPAPDLQAYIREGRKGGLGLRLVHLIMDQVDFLTTADGQNLTRLTKNL